jgi:hypothetical protein
MTTTASTHCLIALAAILAAPSLHADFTPANLAAPFGVQPFAGLTVTGGVTQPFFSDLSGLPFTGPNIVDVLGDLQAFDSMGNPIPTFTVTGVSVTQSGSTVSPSLEPFTLTSPVTYASTLNPFNSATVDPSQYNLAFLFASDASFEYSYTLDVSGVPNGGFVLYNDIEAALSPEPGTWPALLILMTAGWIYLYRRERAANSVKSPRRP